MSQQDSQRDQGDHDTKAEDESSQPGPRREADEGSQEDAGMSGGSSDPTAEGATGGSDERVGAEDEG